MLLIKTRAGPSSIHGTGLFAAEAVRQDTVVWRFDDSTEESFSREEAEALPEPKRTRVLSLVHSYISNPDGRYILSKDDAIYFNHSFAPNIVETGDGQCRALRDIPCGEELTVDYRDYAEDNPLNFEVVR
jgi:SET domain-containing protein